MATVGRVDRPVLPTRPGMTRPPMTDEAYRALGDRFRSQGWLPPADADAYYAEQARRFNESTVTQANKARARRPRGTS